MAEIYYHTWHIHITMVTHTTMGTDTYYHGDIHAIMMAHTTMHGWHMYTLPGLSLILGMTL